MNVMKRLLAALALCLLAAAPGRAQQTAAKSYAGLPLDAAEAAAVAAAPDVAAADARVRQSADLLHAARASFGPALTTGYTEAPQGGASGETIAQRLTTVGAQFSIGDLLVYSPAVAQAAANLQMAQLDLQAAQRAEQIKAIGLYYDALRADASLDARAQALRAVQTDLGAAQKRYEAGVAPHLDVVRAQVAVAKATADLDHAKAADANARQALTIETGRPESLLTDLVTDPGVQAPLETDWQRAVSLALARRPEVASAQEAVRAAAAAGIAARGVLPLLTVSAGYMRGVDSGVHVRGPSLSAQLSFPLSPAASWRADAERARVEQARAKLASVQRQIALEVASAVRSYEAGARASAAAARAREAAQAELSATEIGYRSGASSSLEVTSARQTYTQALLDELAAVYAQAQARATLRALMGY